jgi:hypothetical protein
MDQAASYRSYIFIYIHIPEVNVKSPIGSVGTGIPSDGKSVTAVLVVPGEVICSHLYP